MKGPDLLKTKWGRLTAFFFLYMTEGIPLGFTATAVATEMRRQGLGVAEIGAFVGSLYLPWAFKWVFGPFVDVLTSDRLGKRRMWIVLAQVMMVLTLMAALPVDFSAQIKLFTFLILLHNVFGATQDVAIDALAVGVLDEKERGLANGMMFAGAYIGQAIGGSGVLFLTKVMSFKATFFFVAAWILSVTLLIALPLKERRGEPRPRSSRSPLATAGSEIAGFVKDAARAFVGTRGAFLGLVFAIMPAGAYALGLALQSNLGVELGLDNTQIAWLNLWSTVISAVGCVAGGFLSDRLGRRRMLAAYIASMSLPTLWLAVALDRHGWIMPVDPQGANRPLAPAALITTFWAATLIYALLNGLMYGTRTALFMDVTTPAVAATQFTAYMALLNLAIAYSAKWQGWAAERWGYPKTLVADAILGVACLILLPFLTPLSRPSVVSLPAESGSVPRAADSR